MIHHSPSKRQRHFAHYHHWQNGVSGRVSCHYHFVVIATKVERNQSPRTCTAPKTRFISSNALWVTFMAHVCGNGASQCGRAWNAVRNSSETNRPLGTSTRLISSIVCMYSGMMLSAKVQMALSNDPLGNGGRAASTSCTSAFIQPRMATRRLAAYFFLFP